MVFCEADMSSAAAHGGYRLMKWMAVGGWGQKWNSLETPNFFSSRMFIFLSVKAGRWREASEKRNIANAPTYFAVLVKNTINQNF